MFRMRLTPILAALTLVLLAGCSTTRIPAPSEAIADLTSNTKVAVVHYDPEQFMIWTGEPKTRTTALSMFGLIGAAIEGGMQQTDAKEVGAKFISSTQLLDPITQVENRFVAAWQRELKLTAVGTSHLVKNNSSQKLLQQFGEGYVIDFKTERWSVDPIIAGGFSFETITYRPSYTGRARLIRLDDQKTLWQGTCEYTKDDSLTPKLTHADILGDDHGVAVKAGIQTLADACADYLWRQFFGRESGPDFPPTTMTEVTK